MLRVFHYIDPNVNSRKMYRVLVTFDVKAPDPDRPFKLLRQWGRIGGKNPQTKVTYHKTKQGADRIANNLCEKKQDKGYFEVDAITLEKLSEKKKVKTLPTQTKTKEKETPKEVKPEEDNRTPEEKFKDFYKKQLFQL